VLAPSTAGVVLKAPIVAQFVKNFLLDRYNDPMPITPFMRRWWAWACNDDPYGALAAPRGHTKSTTINHGYGLAAGLFQQHPFQLKISNTRSIAVEYLRSAKNEITDNPKIKAQFGFKNLLRDTEDDFIAEFTSGYQMRMMAFGSEQAMRGATWGTRRPSLVLGDDLENDEQVMNAERRDKMMRWWMNTVMPIGGRHTKYRVLGTVLHLQSLLMALLDDPNWHGQIYRAHDDHFENILWPEMFPRERLEMIRTSYIAQGNLIGYNMEYLNQAVDMSSGYFQPSDFLQMQDYDHNKPHTFYVGGDFAISKKARRDHTVFEIGGLDPDGFLDIVDERRGRWDANEIINEMFAIEEQWHPEIWFVESGSIFKTLQSMIETEMRRRGVFLHLKPMTPIGNKTERARAIQRRMRARGVRFNAETTWYPELQQELLQFRDADEVNDRVDALAWMGIGLATENLPLTVDDAEEEEFKRDEQQSYSLMGISPVTGY
jgi:predicted phage terminase large subunit-like protein